MEVKTVQTFREYEYTYEVAKNGDVQPYKGFTAIIAAYDELEDSDMGSLYLLGMNQTIPTINPNYDKGLEEEEEEKYPEYIEVDYIEKGEGKNLVRFTMKKIVEYDKSKDVIHESKQQVSSSVQGFTFMEKTAKKFTRHIRTKVKVEDFDLPNLKKVIILELPEDIITEYQEDGTGQSVVLTKLELYYFYK